MNHACISVITLVGEELFGLECGEHHVGTIEIGGLSAAEMEAQRIAQCIHGGVNLGAQSAFAAADGLGDRFFARARAMLMRSHDGAVDHGVFVVGILAQVFEHAQLDAALGPAAEPPVGVLPVPRAWRQITPGNAGAVAVQHRFYKASIVLSWSAYLTFALWKQLADAFSLVVAQPVSSYCLALNGRGPLRV